MKKHPIFQEFPDKDNVEKLLRQDRCEIDYEFPGFVEIYENLAKIIPQHFYVIDFGCYMAAQCVYFKDHRSYIGVDTNDLVRFNTHNSKHYVMSIKDYIKNVQWGKLDETFAICSYVPDRLSCELVRSTYKNVFCFYPSGSPHKGI